MLKIENHKKLLGKELYGSGKSGSTYWKVVSIMEHLNHYVIFIEQPDTGWERKVTLHRHSQMQTIPKYRLESGTEYILLVTDSIKQVDVFTNYLESFL